AGVVLVARPLASTRRGGLPRLGHPGRTAGLVAVLRRDCRLVRHRDCRPRQALARACPKNEPPERPCRKLRRKLCRNASKLTDWFDKGCDKGMRQRRDWAATTPGKCAGAHRQARPHDRAKRTAAHVGDSRHAPPWFRLRRVANRARPEERRVRSLLDA